LRASRSSLAAVCALAIASATGCSSRTVVLVDPAGPGSLLNDIVGYWQLDDPPGSTVAQDSSGWGNDGTLIDLSPTAAWTANGRAGGALTIQGTGAVEVPVSQSIESIRAEVTMAAWVFVEGTITDYGTAISRQIGTSYEQSYHLAINAQDHPTMYITTGAKVFLQGGPTVPHQTWVHLAGTYDGTEARLYLDGVEVAHTPQSGTLPTDGNPVLLSGNVDAVNDRAESFPGRLDEVMLYRRALDADEVSRLHNGALLH
jgi:hypothetical protein